MPRRPITVFTEDQNIKDDGFLEDYPFDPPAVIRFFTSNIVTRTIAHLIGWTGSKSLRLKCTAAGVLKTAPIGTGYEHNDTKSGTATDAWSSAITFDEIVSTIDIFTWDNPLNFQRSADGVTFEDEIEIPANSVYSFDCATHSFKVQNKNAGFASRYQIIGWY
jgi:hypothetical protein